MFKKCVGWKSCLSLYPRLPLQPRYHISSQEIRLVSKTGSPTRSQNQNQPPVCGCIRSKIMDNHKCTFECPICGYQNYMGNTEVCPVCEPEKDEAQDLCNFVNLETRRCSQDNQTCPYIESKKWEECPKLQGYNPGLAKE